MDPIFFDKIILFNYIFFSIIFCNRVNLAINSSDFTLPSNTPLVSGEHYPKMLTFEAF